MVNLKKWISHNCFRIIYIIFLTNLFIEIILRTFYNEYENLKPIFDLLFCFLIGLVIGSYLTTQCVKVLKKNIE